MSPLTVRPLHLAGAAALAVVATLGARAMWPSSTASASVNPASNVAVNCEPGQQALVRQTVMNGEPHVAIQCASTLSQGAMFGNATGFPPGYGDARLIPANYVLPVREAAPVVRTTSAPRRASVQGVEPKRTDWKKTALLIGGSAGAGAGIGGLIAGKKGALIGAAIGGGGAGLIEAIRR